MQAFAQELRQYVALGRGSRVQELGVWGFGIPGPVTFIFLRFVHFLFRKIPTHLHPKGLRRLSTSMPVRLPSLANSLQQTRAGRRGRGCMCRFAFQGLRCQDVVGFRCLLQPTGRGNLVKSRWGCCS